MIVCVRVCLCNCMSLPVCLCVWRSLLSAQSTPLILFSNTFISIQFLTTIPNALSVRVRVCGVLECACMCIRALLRACMPVRSFCLCVCVCACACGRTHACVCWYANVFVCASDRA